MTLLQKTLITTTIAILAVTAVYETRRASHSRLQQEALQQLQTPLMNQLQQLQRERDDTTNRLAELQAENSQLKSNLNHSGVLKLRGEVGVLRQQKAQLEQTVSGMQAAGIKPEIEFSTNVLEKTSWTFAGYGTPEAALQSCLWAKSVGNEKIWLASIGATNVVNRLKSSYIQGKTEEERTQFLVNQFKNIMGFRILRAIPIDANTVHLQIELSCEGEDGKPHTQISVEEITRLNGTWKVSGEYNG